MPQMRKEICFDCKVKGKNRCVECEKNLLTSIAFAFQQLLLTTNSNIGIAGRQMMDQKPENWTEDVKADIEKEMIELYKPASKATQPAVVSTPSSDRPAQSQEANQKGIGALTGTHQHPISRPGSGRNKWISLSVIILVVLALLFYLIEERTSDQGNSRAIPDRTEADSYETKGCSPVQTKTTPLQSLPIKKRYKRERCRRNPPWKRKMPIMTQEWKLTRKGKDWMPFVFSKIRKCKIILHAGIDL